MTDQSQQSLNATETDQTVVSEPPNQSIENDLSGPDYRSHIGRGEGAVVITLYETGQNVYVQGARSLRGPYTIKKANSDGTYRLENADGSVYRDNVKERDLKLV